MASLGGGGQPGVSPFWDNAITPPNTFLFSLCLVPILNWTENPLILRRKPFFGLHLFLDQKKMAPRNFAPGATILSNATAPRTPSNRPHKSIYTATNPSRSTTDPLPPIPVTPPPPSRSNTRRNCTYITTSYRCLRN